MRSLVILAGPTAVGKTQASIGLAKALGGEIISGDSMQVFRGMDIGTAKIPEAERAGVPHHMLDIKDPRERFSAAEFRARTDALIEEIDGRGHLPILVGGTGLYISAVLYPYEFARAETDAAYREELADYAAANGRQALWQLLEERDPASAARLHPNDVQRVVRALEIAHVTGAPASSRQQGVDRGQMRYRAAYLALSLPREELYARIDRRVDAMLSAGLEQEVRRLLAEGVPPDAQSMTGLGYRQMVRYLEGEYALERAAELIKRDTRRFAKRQLTWFRHDPNVRWVEKAGKSEAQVLSELLRLVRERLGDSLLPRA